jgi:hypothetical protein
LLGVGRVCLGCHCWAKTDQLASLDGITPRMVVADLRHYERADCKSAVHRERRWCVVHSTSD